MALLVEERTIPPATPVKHPKSPNEELVQVCMAHPGHTAISLFEKCYSVASQKDAMSRLRVLFEMENAPVRREQIHDPVAKRTLFHYFPTEFAASYTDTASKSEDMPVDKPKRSAKTEKKAVLLPEVPALQDAAPTPASETGDINTSAGNEGATEVEPVNAPDKTAAKRKHTRKEGSAGRTGRPRKDRASAPQESVAEAGASTQPAQPASDTRDVAALVAALAEKDNVLQRQSLAMEEGARVLANQRELVETLRQELAELQSREKSRAGYVVLAGDTPLIPSMEAAREEVERRIKEGDRSLYIAGITSKAEMVVTWTE